MGDFAPIITAIITTAGAILVAALGARRFARNGSTGSTSVQLNRNLRELAETERAKGELWHEKYDNEVTSHAATKVMLAQAQYDADTCQRRLDNAYADMRLDSKTHETRAARPGETIGAGETGTE